jgi:hypothetical protein
MNSEHLKNKIKSILSVLDRNHDRKYIKDFLEEKILLLDSKIKDFDGGSLYSEFLKTIIDELNVKLQSSQLELWYDNFDPVKEILSKLEDVKTIIEKFKIDIYFSTEFYYDKEYIGKYIFHVINIHELYRKGYCFLEFDNGSLLEMSEEFDELIDVDSIDVINDDFVFLRAMNDFEGVGVYSISKQKLILPFVIIEYRYIEEFGLYYIKVENTMFFDDCNNYENNFAYLDRNLDFFQNVGEIEEKISNKLFIVNCCPTSEFTGYSLYNDNSENESMIDYDQITDYRYDNEILYLTIDYSKEIKVKIE